MRINSPSPFVTMAEMSIAKTWVLLLGCSLLAGGPSCACAAPPSEASTSCGHCPEERPAPERCPKGDCGCIHEGSDRSIERSDELLASAPTLDAPFLEILETPLLAASLHCPGPESPTPIGRSDLPLYLSLRHLLL